ncbi:MAG: hypothetical protein KKG50_03410 [Candidatus Omnitrophica bacterium]|nr:hypothetical protein [Candidatus Omnitrophota bacterium]
MEKYSGSEKRKHPRIGANFIINYRVKQVPNNYDLSQTKDVGQGGSLLTTNRKFEKGTILAVTVRFPYTVEKVELTAEVVGSEEVARNLVYNTRIKFLDLDKEFFQELGKFIQDRLKTIAADKQRKARLNLNEN